MNHSIIFKLSLIAFALCVFVLPMQIRAATMKAASGSGLVGYWSFNEGSSTIAHDFSGNGLDGALSGTTLPQWVSGRLSTALRFDGSSSYFFNNSAKLNLNGDLTISLWIDPAGWNDVNNAAKNPVLEGRSGGGVGPYTLYASPTVIRFLQHQTSGGDVNHWFTVNGTTAVPSNTWTFVTITRSGSTITVYKNGVQVGTGTADGTVDTTYSGFRVGKGQYDVTYYWNGGLDELRMYNRALSQAEITGLYWSGLAVVNTSKVNDTTKNTSLTSGLVGWWTMDGPDTMWTSGTAGITADRSGNLNTGTLTSMTRLGSPAAGKIGQALKFSGNYVNIGSNSSLNVGTSLTYSIWAKRTGNTTSQWPLFLASNSNTHIYYGIRSQSFGDFVTFEYGTSPYDGVTGHYTNVSCGGVNSLPLNTWVLFTVTYDGSTLMCYKNGVFFAQKTSVTLNPSISTGQIGDAGDANMILDDARIYNRPLSAAEVKQLYQQGGGVTINSASQNLDNGSTVGTGLVGLWTFNGPDLTDKVYDRSGSGNNGYFIGSATSSAKVAGKLGQGLKFNGGSWINVGNTNSLTGTMTLSAWVKLSSTTDGQAIICKAEGGAYCMEFGVQASGKFGWNPHIGGAYRQVYADTAAVAGVWYHVVGTYDGSTVKMYINGVLQSVTVSISGSVSTTSVDLAIGGNPTGSHTVASNYFSGVIDDVRIYSKALSSSEVKQLYNLGK